MIPFSSSAVAATRSRKEALYQPGENKTKPETNEEEEEPENWTKEPDEGVSET